MVTNNIGCRFFSRRLIEEFDIESKNFSFEIQNSFLQAHSNERIWTGEDFDRIIDHNIDLQQTEVLNNAIRMNNIDRSLHVNRNINELVPEESAFLEASNSIENNIRNLENEREEIIARTQELNEDMDALLELRELGSDIVRELLYQEPGIIITFGLVLLILKLIKKNRDNISRARIFVCGYLRGVFDETKTYLKDDIEEKTNKPRLVVGLGTLAIVMSLFKKGVEKYMLKALTKIEEKEFFGNFAKTLKKSLEKKQEYKTEQHKLWFEYFGNNLTNYEETKEFREFQSQSYNADQQIPTRQRFEAFQNLMSTNVKTTVIKGKNNKGENIIQETKVFKTGNSIRKKKKEIGVALLNFWKKCGKK